MDRSLIITYMPGLETMTLDEASDLVLRASAPHPIDCVCWPDVTSYAPLTAFAVARSDSALYIRFDVKDMGLRAVVDSDLGPVAQDSCVEFFVQVPGSDEYWNFEFNCIGMLNASHRVERDKPTRLTAEQLASVERLSTLGPQPFAEREGMHEWTLTVKLPLALLGLDSNNLPEQLRGNFYKCGSATAHPHYLAWNEVDGETPNFHRPDCFGTLWF